MAKAHPLRALEHYLEQTPDHCFWRLGQNAPEKKPGHNKVLFLNAQYSEGLFRMPMLQGRLVCEQPFRPSFLQLTQNNVQVSGNLSDSSGRYPDKFHAAIVLISKHRHYNEYLIRRAHSLTRSGGFVLVVGTRDTGAASLRKRLAKEFELTDSYSKYHSIVFEMKSLPEADFDERQLFEQIEDDARTFITAKGLFSSSKIDEGSFLLSQHFDDGIKGAVADLGSGWGYLSAGLLSRSANITALDCYEAEALALHLCQQNLSVMNLNTPIGYYWHDVVGELISRKYDWVIMNPPFHLDRQTRTDIGAAFIRQASSILRNGGRLLMVANRQLAYEPVLKKFFSSFQIVEENPGFKIIRAIRS